ncbi:MAG: bifunctional glutamate N-acetyltransferase/amino-acid acetyltransferase ArgJ [Desulfohalobiaceae bacterium]|nr:bifunctional glutamate N-acetyltransferase/amino-acid acetyltransferase ArgJ [Desulfohalobiaceae bacterium]
MEIPAGFFFLTAEAGFRGKERPDLAYIGSDRPASAAGVFTRNVFQAAPVFLARERLENRAPLRGLLVNVGQANACTGEQGIDDCRESLSYVASRLGLEPGDILPASTGVIGEPLEMERFKHGAHSLASSRPATALDAAKAITTTDTFPKLCLRDMDCESGTIRILGLAKGAGMICPDMATMLAFVCTDAAIPRDAWRDILASATEESFNRISVDGDTSTNDCLVGLANGASGIQPSEEDLELFRELILDVCQELSYRIVQDAEGGTKVLNIEVSGAENNEQAEWAVRSVAHSPLVKTAMYGLDPNWGRIVAALGRSGARFDPEDVTLSLSGVILWDKGRVLASHAESQLAEVMQQRKIHIRAELGQGEGRSRILTSDLSPEYVRINAEYRS